MLTWIWLSLFFFLIYWTFKKPSGLPPGRWGLPVLGYFPLYTLDIGRVISDFRKEFGDIFTWKVGGLPLVILCDYKLIKTTFNKPECQGRPYIFSLDLAKYHSNSGIIGAEGEVWSEGRRFALRHLKDFGMGKSSLESVIQYEVQVLLEDFERNSGAPVHISWSLNVAVLNIIWKLVADLRYDINDEKIKEFHGMFEENISISTKQAVLLDLFPGLNNYLPEFILNKLMKVNVLYKNMYKFKDMIDELIREHEETFDPENPRDYIDAYLKEVQKEKENPNTVFKSDDLNLVTSIGDLFVAGSETTSSTIRWMVALLAEYPDVQKKMQQELDGVVPSDRQPSLQDKDKLPYTEAVLLEVMRYSSFVPIGLPHSTTEDIEVKGYPLPKNTILVASARSCHRDPKYFERPDEFYPEHFLDDQGKVNLKKEGFLPFSLGRRQCLGENLARTELFLFSSGIFHKFSASSPEGEPIKADSDPSQMFLHFVKPYRVVLTKRH